MLYSPIIAPLLLLSLVQGQSAHARTAPDTFSLQRELLLQEVVGEHGPRLPVIDHVEVRKSDRQLLLVSNGVPIRVYPIALGDSPVGHKRFEGDERTPEGTYVLDWRNPDSSFHKSIHINYPNPQDQAYADSLGFPAGGMIMIHGWPNQPSPRQTPDYLALTDWTDGCIAVSNRAMDEIWNLVEDGTLINIKP